MYGDDLGIVSTIKYTAMCLEIQPLFLDFLQLMHIKQGKYPQFVHTNNNYLKTVSTFDLSWDFNENVSLPSQNRYFLVLT